MAHGAANAVTRAPMGENTGFLFGSVTGDLLAHTNVIDADLFFPDAAGRDALRVFVDGLGQYCGALLGPGEYIS